jgi:hypothetical protein
MDIVIIKEFVKHNRVFEVGQVLGLTKLKAKYYVDNGFAKYANEPIKEVETKKVETVKKVNKKKKK